MEAQKSGCIVNVSSIAGIRGLPNQLAYTASKHAVIGMTKTAALEGARYGIRVNAICPVFTQTPLVDKLFASVEGIDQKLLRTIPLRRFGEVEDIVNAIFWLCDDSSSFITAMPCLIALILNHIQSPNESYNLTPLGLCITPLNVMS